MDYTPDDKHKIKEIEQRENAAKEIAKEYQKKQISDKKKYIGIVIIAVIVAGFFGVSSFLSMDLMNDEYKITSDIPPRSQFLIQNLKGDIIDTWIAWKVVEGDVFHVHVQNSTHATDERLTIIFDVIMSEQSIELDDSLFHTGQPDSTSTFYLGWRGALNSISEETESPIPKNLHFHVTDKGEGDVIIGLTNLSNPNGYSGFTKAIVDEENHQILKASITIHDIENLSSSQLSTILRHELGHAFGLAHSSAPEDLMAPVIITDYPYISNCDLDAITLLYDGGQSSQVVCEK